MSREIEENIERANGLMKHEIWNEAIAAWKHVLSLSPNEPTVHSKLAHCYINIGDISNAESYAEEARKRDSSDTLAAQILEVVRKHKPSKINATSIYGSVYAVILVVLVLATGIGVYIAATNTQYLNIFSTVDQAAEDSLEIKQEEWEAQRLEKIKKMNKKPYRRSKFPKSTRPK